VSTVPPAVLVVGLGARTAIGTRAAGTAAAVRAGVSGAAQHPFVVDSAGRRMVVARAPYLDMAATWTERVSALAGAAATEAAFPLAETGRDGGVPDRSLPVFLGLPPPRPGRAADHVPITERVAANLAELGITARMAAPSEAGHASGAMALGAAWRAVRSGATPFALAGGVDSYLDAETLEWLEANDQVHAAGPYNNPHGFIPGEGAGFVLLAAAPVAEPAGLKAATELSAVAAATEAKLIKTAAVCVGEGLTDLFRHLKAGLEAGTQVDELYCDMNGEPYRADEFGFATIRAGELFRNASEFIAPADCWGDVGAASAPLFLMLADAAVRRCYASGPVSAGFTSAESGVRAGFIARAWMADRNAG